jgi:hypothetical protein
MRLFCRVFLIVLLFTVAARAADGKQPVIAEHTFTVQVPADTNQPHAKNGDTVFPSMDVPRKIPSDQIELRAPCLTMRSMKFAQVGRDQVRYQSTTTCTPATQFQVKRAVLPRDPQ